MVSYCIIMQVHCFCSIIWYIFVCVSKFFCKW